MKQQILLPCYCAAYETSDCGDDCSQGSKYAAYDAYC